MMKVSKITLGLFSSGFILFSLYKYFSQKRITKEQISKIIKKISNLSIQFMFQRYDSQNKILNQKKEAQLDNKDIILEQNDDNKNKNENDNDKIEESFDNEVLFVLLQIENEKIKSLEITNEEFQEYLLEYKDEDIEITKNFNLIQKVLNSFKQRKLPVINFGFILPEKYLQIISNIFYFNLKKTNTIYYDKLNIMNNNENNLSFKEKNEIYNNIYNNNLKQTRNEVCSYFGLDKDNNLEINIKLALRIFPFYFDKKHTLRIKYQEINDNVNKLINIILKCGDKVDVFSIKEYQDRIINFKDIINQINPDINNDIFNNIEEIPYEDQCD